MAISKIILNGTTQMDVTDTTATANDVINKYFYDAAGVKTLGTATGGGGGDTWAWYGTNAELIETVKQTVALKDTDYNTWTPSTTQTTIYTGYSSAHANDFTQYTYVCVLRFVFEPVYQTGTTLLAAPTRFIFLGISERYLSPANTAASWNSDTRNTNNGYGGTAMTRLFYKDTSGTDAVYSSGNGVYCNSIGYNSTQRKFACVVYARCSDTHFSTTMANALDKTNSKFTYAFDIYRIPANKSVANGDMNTAMDLYQNGIT